MSGYRMCLGYGSLDNVTVTTVGGQSNSYRRANAGTVNVKPDVLPTYNGLPITPLQALSSKASDGSFALGRRFGAGVTLTLSRNRNNNYHQDIGLREFSVATSGMYEGDWNISGIFVPEYSQWLRYAFYSDPVRIKSGAVFSKSSTTYTASTDVPTVNTSVGKVVDGATTTYYKWTTGGWVVNASATAATWPSASSQYSSLKALVAATNAVVGYVFSSTSATSALSTTPIGFADFTRYLTAIGSTSEEIDIYQYQLYDAPITFDMGFAQINNKTAFGGDNEIGILCGCSIESASISYDSGSEAAVKITIDGHFLLDYMQPVSSDFNYNLFLDDIPQKPLVAGCISVSKDGQSYSAIAQTESAGISIANNLYKLGNCLKLNYSSYSAGALSYSVNTTTYSNNPNKYLSTFYGYDSLDTNTVYTVAKQPVSLPYVKIRSDDTNAVLTTATQFLDINMEDVFVGTMNRSYDVGNAIMDEPDLRSRHINIAVGFTPNS